MAAFNSNLIGTDLWASLGLMRAGAQAASTSDSPVAAPGDGGNFTTEQAADQILRDGWSWRDTPGPITLTYAFRESAPETMPGTSGGFSQFGAAEIGSAVLALRAWADVSGLSFMRIVDDDGFSNNATMLFANYSSGVSGAAAFAYPPEFGDGPPNQHPSSIEGDVWNNSTEDDDDPTYWNTGAFGAGPIMVHEIGHALGLAHPGDYNADPEVTITYAEHAQYVEDTRQYSMMSYFSETNTGANFNGFFAGSPLYDDITAIQQLYGANETAFSGDTTYGYGVAVVGNPEYRPYYKVTSGSPLIFCAYDTGGDDTFNFSGFTQNQLIDLVAGRDHFSNVGGMIGNVSIYQGSVIEDAYGGTGNDTIHGNAADNVLVGVAGGDLINGADGADLLVGDNLNNGVSGADTLNGGNENDTLIGGAGLDLLSGGDGDDLLDYTTGDTVFGGLGLDTVKVDSTKISSGSVSIDNVAVFNGVENLEAYGAGDIALTGTSAANQLTGGDGANTVTGQAGADTIMGGLGDDDLRGGADGDRIYGGTADFSILDGADSILGEAGADTIDGNRGDDTIDGGADNDSIFGGADDQDKLRGGTGNDTLDGGSGDDSLNAGTGTDSLIGGAGDDVLDFGTSTGWALGGDAYDVLIVDTGDQAASISATTVSWGGDSITYSGIEAFDITSGSAGGSLTTGAGDDIVRIGDGRRVIDMAGQGARGDLLVIDWSAAGTDRFISNPVALAAHGYVGGYHWAPDANNTLHNRVQFSGVERFDVTFAAGDDIIYTGANADTVRGGAGADILHTGAGADVIDGGAQTSAPDIWVADKSAATQALTINLNITSTYAVGGVQGSVTGVEQLGINSSHAFVTGAGADTITTLNGAFHDYIATREGADTVKLFGGRDLVAMGAQTGLGDVLSIDWSAAGLDRFISNPVALASDGYVGDLYWAVDANNSGHNRAQFSGVERFAITLAGGDDIVYTGDNADTVNGGAGADILHTGGGADIVNGGTDVGAPDIWVANKSAATAAIVINLNGSSTYAIGGVNGSVRLIEQLGVSSSSHVFSTGSGSDVITTVREHFHDNIATNAGADTVKLFGGRDQVAMGGQGGAGDLLVIDWSTAGADRFVGNPLALASDGYVGDLYWATNANNTAHNRVQFSGVERFDIQLAGGDDIVYAGDNADTIRSGGGADLILSGKGADVIDGGAGVIDIWAADKSAAVKAMVINLEAASSGYKIGVQSGLVKGVEQLGWRAGGVAFTTGEGADVVTTLNAFLADMISTGAGNDRIILAGGRDLVSMGGGVDTLAIDWSSATAGFTHGGLALAFDGYTGDFYWGPDANNASVNRAQFSGVEAFDLRFGAGADSMIAGKGHDTLTGGAGADTLNAGLGNDALQGDDGADLLLAGEGRDTLTGGLSADILEGGAGADRFVFASKADSSKSAADHITDIQGIDTIDLSVIDANSKIAGNQAFALVDAFDKHAGQLIVVYKSALDQTLVQGDVNGDGKVDFTIILDGRHDDFTNFAL